MMLLTAEVWAAGHKDIQVGLLYDVKSEISTQFTDRLRAEISSLLGNRYDISIPDKKIRVAQWTAESVRSNYAVLVEDPAVDIIVSVGALSAAVLTQQKQYSKPLIILGIVDYELQGIAVKDESYSGVDNLTYVLQAHSFSADLKDFKAIYPFQNLAVIYDRRLTELLPGQGQELLEEVKDLGGQGHLVSYDGEIQALLDNIPKHVDAVLLGGLYTLTYAEREKLIKHVNQMKIPSYSLLGLLDVKRGILAGANPDTNWQKITRRIALNIERILDGENPADLEILVRTERHLSINMQTANQIGFSPNWTALADAELLLADSFSRGEFLDFRSVVERALRVNLAVEIEKLSIDSVAEDISQASALLLPQLNGSLSAVRVDNESAGAFQAENTYSGSLTVDQLIYSEPAYANLAIQKRLYGSAQEKYRGVRFDTVLDTGLSYLDILKAQSAVKTNRNNLRLVRKNLDIADYRFKVGYAGKADVYRLTSELSSARSNLLDAESVLSKLRMRLNEILREPLNKEFTLEDVFLSGELMQRYGGDQVRASINTPAEMERLTQFLVSEAMNKLPEINQLREALAVQERLLLSAQRQRWLPTVNLRGKADQVFERTGIGASLLDDNQRSWNISLAASWELFSGGEINSEVRQATIERDRLQKVLLNTKRGLELVLRNALLDLRVKSVNIDLFRSSAEAARGNYDLVQDLYAQGRATITALLDAQNVALISEQSAANSVYDFYAAILQVERAMGDFALLTSLENQQEFFKRLQMFMGAQ